MLARIPESSVWNPLVRVFIVGVILGAFTGTFMACLMEYGGELNGG